MKTRDGYVISTKGAAKINNSIEESIYTIHYRQGDSKPRTKSHRSCAAASAYRTVPVYLIQSPDPTLRVFRIQVTDG